MREVDEELRAKQHKDIQDVIEVRDQIECNDWESDFLASIFDWTVTKTLTPKQERVFARLAMRARGLHEGRGQDRERLKKKLEERLKEKPKVRKKTPQELWDETPVPHPDDGEVFL